MDKKSLKFPSLTAKNSLAVVAVGSLSWALRSIPRRGQFSTLLLLGLWSEPMGGHKVWRKGVRKGGKMGWFIECQVSLNDWGNGGCVDDLLR